MDAEQVLSEIDDLVAQRVVAEIAWYQKRKRWPRRMSRLASVLSIAIAATITLLAGLGNDPSLRIAIAVLGAVAAVAAGVDASYQWRRTWQGYHGAQVALEEALDAWRIASIQARLADDASKVAPTLVRATKRLLAEAAKIKGEEAGAFFNRLNDGSVGPKADGSQDGDG